ncbi:Dam family site-specific DNA-(adenine-N6)-methyltransferase [Candidatus Poseidoniaceae archaeon]|nr:Dam family site-specific DNA-(adenine-N6)-methyltransferase [Candidatus Poseidoniaceae archaeon]
MARPFLKWAGGKGRLMKQILPRLPPLHNTEYTFFEPFLGGGALFFELESKGLIKSAHLSDINPELVLCYVTIKNDIELLIEELKRLNKKYPKRDAYRKKFFYRIRDKWNESLCDDISTLTKKQAAKRVAKTIFLNKTCFNGLFRVNSKGKFNVPYGYYKNPSFVNEENLRDVSKSLECATIKCQPYNHIKLEGNSNFVYFDPPYRPLTDSSSFTAYSKSGFNDNNQKELSEFVTSISDFTYFMLSNSDPKNADERDNFFDELYKEFKIIRILAPRSINSDGKGRGKISEILVTNY